MTDPTPGALEGIRVLDLGLLVQAPQAGQLLGDLGADVIKVELPGLGDQARWIPASMEDLRPAYFIGCNRGKRSLTLDLRTEAGRDVFLRLAETADVIVSNFLPGTLERWGLSYEEVSARNPRIVYACGSSFGPVGPDADRKGADLAGQAAGGLIRRTGPGNPTPVGVTIADHIGSQNMCNGVLAALFARERTGARPARRRLAPRRPDLRPGLRVHLHLPHRPGTGRGRPRPPAAAHDVRHLPDRGRAHRHRGRSGARPGRLL